MGDNREFGLGALKLPGGNHKLTRVRSMDEESVRSMGSLPLEQEERMQLLLVKNRSGINASSFVKPVDEILHKATHSLVEKNGRINGVDEAKSSESHKVSFFKLFQFADQFDVLLMLLGFCGAVGDGVAFSAMLYVLSGLIDVFGNRSLNSHEFMHEISKVNSFSAHI